jgi:hypothetical protein
MNRTALILAALACLMVVAGCSSSGPSATSTAQGLPSSPSAAGTLMPVLLLYPLRLQAAARETPTSTSHDG